MEKKKVLRKVKSILLADQLGNMLIFVQHNKVSMYFEFSTE
jgi:hypothetical protein